jgi:DnaJ-domain-containing protein 1
MLELYQDSDAQSASVLTAYLDREHGEDWRERSESEPGESADRGAAHTNAMTKADAWAILGLAPGADADAIRAAHRRLMQKLHPDRGGSDYLAAQINAAKALLLDD